ncbi:calsyntenin-1 [Echinops telfairi]|uniref:Calsyntenin-1 n=1 Tax=Echinops telfairi TaxID=9371 RepID=A0AC55DTR8_ECHTE|nr:calsyntenin-1 [Echinops telfairi]
MATLCTNRRRWDLAMLPPWPARSQPLSVASGQSHREETVVAVFSAAQQGRTQGDTTDDRRKPRALLATVTLQPMAAAAMRIRWPWSLGHLARPRQFRPSPPLGTEDTEARARRAVRVWGCGTSPAANKHKPWLEPTYHGIITENDNTVLLDPPLIALDKDAPLRFAESFEVAVTKEGEICRFKIHGQNVPFEAVVVDKSTGEGLIRSKEKLDCELQKDYTFTIQAYDCGRGPDGAEVKKSHKATVHIQVNDVNEYAPVFKEKAYKATVVEGRQYDSILRVEALDADCSPQFSQICSYEVVTPDVPFTVDKDGFIKNTEKLNYGKEHQYKVHCPTLPLDKEPLVLPAGSAAPGPAELLPSPSSALNWTAGLPTDNGHDSDQVFEFNGTQAVRIPDGIVAVHPREPFTISVWMRHGPFSRTKETILCSSDKTDMNRHHYSLYVHGCRLVFLLRQDPAEEKKYKPAEFHWKLSQVCDSEWHHYVLNVELPSVTLHLDGAEHEPFSVMADYPLHPSRIETQLVVGACWQELSGLETDNETEPVAMAPAGGDLHMTQFFRGNLAGLTIRSGKVADKKVIDCLYTCKEGLDLQVLEDSSKGLKIQVNPSHSALTLEGEDIGELDKAMQHISYLNSRQFPTPGIRRLKITSAVKCFNEAPCISIPPVDSYVMVLQPEEPKISLSGVHHFARAASEFESPEGVFLFPELRIISTITREVEPEHDGDEDPTVQESLVSEEIVHDLDTCEVTVEGEDLNREQESLEVDLTRLQQKGIEMSSSDLGVVFTGKGLGRARQVGTRWLSQLPAHACVGGHRAASSVSGPLVSVSDWGAGGGGAGLTRPSPCQTYEDQHSSEEEEEEEEEESEEGEEDDDITSAESESSEEEEGAHGDQPSASRQQQLEWDDSTLSY